ncbi:MAG: DNA polymerase IV [Bacteroidetes bacterium]|nr:MAG: DNA polymerase IV [Bacteroidota bacterium]
MSRHIIHLDLDCFFVACEVLRDSRLRGRPVIVGGQQGRGVVAACSYEARRFGVRAAMPIAYAKQRCPEALVLQGDMELYSNYAKLVRTIIREEAPLFEQASIDEFYLDLSGMDHLRALHQWGRELQALVQRESGLQASFGLSINKSVAKMATNEGKPGGHLEVPAIQVRPFLNPLSIEKIPQLGPKTFRRLTRVGIRQIKTLAEVPVAFVEHLLGKNGRILWERANGIDPRPVVPYREQQALSAEQTLATDSMDVLALKALLTRLLTQLCFELRQAQKLTSILSVKIRYNNFDTYSRQRRIPYTDSDTYLTQLAHTLFDELYTRRMRIRLVGVRLAGLVKGHPQIALFADNQKDLALQQALDEIRRKFGMEAVRRGIP